MKNIVACCAVLLLIAGCGTNVSMKGKVTFEDDGSPLTKGQVVFSTPTFQASGELKEDGSFVIGSQRSNDGLPPGTYKVAIFGAEDSIDTNSVSQPSYSLIDPKYSSPQTTDLTFEVTPSTRVYNIKVPRNPAPRPK